MRQRFISWQIKPQLPWKSSSPCSARIPSWCITDIDDSRVSREVAKRSSHKTGVETAPRANNADNTCFREETPGGVDRDSLSVLIPTSCGVRSCRTASPSTRNTQHAIKAHACVKTFDRETTPDEIFKLEICLRNMADAQQGSSFERLEDTVQRSPQKDPVCSARSRAERFVADVLTNVSLQQLKDAKVVSTWQRWQQAALLKQCFVVWAQQLAKAWTEDPERAAAEMQRLEVPRASVCLSIVERRRLSCNVVLQTKPTLSESCRLKNRTKPSLTGPVGSSPIRTPRRTRGAASEAKGAGNKSRTPDTTRQNSPSGDEKRPERDQGAGSLHSDEHSQSDESLEEGHDGESKSDMVNQRGSQLLHSSFTACDDDERSYLAQIGYKLGVSELVLSRNRNAFVMATNGNKVTNGKLHKSQFEAVTNVLRLPAMQHHHMMESLHDIVDQGSQLDFAEYMKAYDKSERHYNSVADARDLKLGQLAWKHKLPSEHVNTVANKLAHIMSIVGIPDHVWSGIDVQITMVKFEQLMRAIFKIPIEHDIDEVRVRHLWSEVDKDQQGIVRPDNLLSWWLKYFSDCMPGEVFIDRLYSKNQLTVFKGERHQRADPSAHNTDVKEGHVFTVIHESTAVYNRFTSWDTCGTLTQDQGVLAAGPLVCFGNHVFLPITPKGYVDFKAIGLRKSPLLLLEERRESSLDFAIRQKGSKESNNPNRQSNKDEAQLSRTI